MQGLFIGHESEREWNHLAFSKRAGMVDQLRSMALQRLKAVVFEFLSLVLLLAGSVAISIHIVLTFYNLHGTVLTLAFVGFWLAGVTGFVKWKERDRVSRPNHQPRAIPKRTASSEESWNDRLSA